jgi:hypothetical protein
VSNAAEIPEADERVKRSFAPAAPRWTVYASLSRTATNTRLQLSLMLLPFVAGLLLLVVVPAVMAGAVAFY